MSDYPPELPEDARNDEPVSKKLALLVILLLGVATLLLPWLIIGDPGSLNPDSHGGRPRAHPAASRKGAPSGGWKPMASASVPGATSGR